MSTAKKLVITDQEISNIIYLREMKKTLSKKLEALDKELKESESDVIKLLEIGADIETQFNISINESFKTYPKYKEEILARMGKEVVEEIINSTKPIRSQKLVISS